MRKRKFETTIITKNAQFQYARVGSPAYKPQILLSAARANTNYAPKKIPSLNTKFMRPTLVIKQNYIDTLIDTHVNAIKNADMENIYESSSTSEITTNLSFMNQQSTVFVEEPVHEFEQLMEEFQKIALDFNSKFTSGQHVEFIIINCRRIFAMVK
ncbi:hypothetical protein SS50377_23686 [Spironucleus salmonicida]|uniref:Uncharacterized protein n=1 Tax=Spironucleus salmonicida TaxID=348837 RepID=V6LWS0_9EUKA|nr:hypothetical protein SS50377_23686 [Spironucleus salmonicida]|eukprot:EST48668.1 Hypothetical protein SS50377_11281 [Spironucleus salmonicida]